jgi:drug/metabolite transporter (DMT)-like permease
MPFFTALLGFLFLKEKISVNVWIAIVIATIGIIIIAFGNTEKNSLIGLIFGMTSSIGFSIFSVTLRWRKETPKFTTVAIAGFFCVFIASIFILLNDTSFYSTSYNGSLFSLHGTIVCMGLILYSIGSKAIPAAELTLLSLTEVIGGIFWVWLPLFGINEIPSTNTIIGGFFLFMSIIYYSLTIKTNRRFIALGNTQKSSLLGIIFGMISSIGFSVFSVTLRWRKETPKFTTVAFSGFFCFTVAATVILTNDMVFLSTSYNGALFSLHGTLVCIGLILYSIGSKAIPAAELTLLSLMEVIGGIFWVWIPILGINEIPSSNTIIGGFFLFMSIIYYSLTIKTNRRFIALN